jgi:hypothetical protein
MKYVLTICAVSSVVFAQGKVQQEPDRVVVKKVSTVDFNVQGIEAARLSPLSGYVTTPPKSHFKSMIKMRANFNPELQASVDQL